MRATVMRRPFARHERVLGVVILQFIDPVLGYLQWRSQMMITLTSDYAKFSSPRVSRELHQ